MIFTTDKIGIITHGAVMIKSHDYDILSPKTICKLGKGKVIGHKSDGLLTCNPQNWIIAYDDMVEVLFFDNDVFQRLWDIQT